MDLVEITDPEEKYEAMTRCTGYFAHLFENLHRVDVCPGADYWITIHLPLAWTDRLSLFLHTARPQRLAAQHGGWSHHRSAGRVLQPGGHRSDGCRSGAGRRGDLAPRDRCRALARPDGGPDGAIQVTSSSRGGNDIDRLARHPNQTLATALAHGCRGAAHPASLRHQPASGHPLSPLEPHQGKRGKLRLSRMRDVCHSAYIKIGRCDLPSR